MKFRLLLLVTSALLMLPASGQDGRVVLEPGFLHLRNAAPREWSSFPEKADADRLNVTFDLDAPESFRLLTWRQEETKQPWSVQLNGRRLATLPRDHNRLEHGLEIPAGLLRATGNLLEIATASETPDDIRIGGLVLRDSIQTLADSERTERLFQQRGMRRALPAMTATVRLAAT
ncbi:MAG TPA: hypothetical protein PLA50_13670, partial [Bacteroidia bacterium]|nr:hypothetical protein [Bacteroidia bacterium]